jgi:hypothetical protein
MTGPQKKQTAALSPPEKLFEDKAGRSSNLKTLDFCNQGIAKKNGKSWIFAKSSRLKRLPNPQST